MKYSGHRKLLCELSKLSKFNASNLLGYKFRPEKTGFNMYAEYTQLQLTFLALYILGLNEPWKLASNFKHAFFLSLFSLIFKNNPASTKNILKSRNERRICSRLFPCCFWSDFYLKNTKWEFVNYLNIVFTIHYSSTKTQSRKESKWENSGLFEVQARLLSRQSNL